MQIFFSLYFISFKLWTLPHLCLYLLFLLLDFHPFADFLKPFLWPHLSSLQVSSFYRLSTCSYCQLPQMFLSSLTICFSLLLKSVIVASATPTYFSPQCSALSPLSFLLMLHVFPANMGHSYQHSLIALICCFLTKISEIWQNISIVFLENIDKDFLAAACQVSYMIVPRWPERSILFLSSGFLTSFIKIDQLSLEGHSLGVLLTYSGQEGGRERVRQREKEWLRGSDRGVGGWLWDFATSARWLLVACSCCNEAAKISVAVKDHN